jgi:glycosyltransferase involved in cell wall biosynthesis
MKVYHCVDRWDAFGMYDSPVMAQSDEACCRLADKVIASSIDLEKRCRRFNSKVRLVTHGVDYRHFAGALSVDARPGDLPPGKVVGFFGLLSEWLDQDLIKSLATSIPHAQIVLIGKADVNVDKLKGVKNLHLLGPRPFAELPEYIARFDVGVIPFVVNDLTRAVNPIKLSEMLADGCPVVSTYLPEVEPYAGKWVDVADTADAFVAYVRNRIAKAPAIEERREISMSVAGETWAAKVDEITEWIGGGRKTLDSGPADPESKT